MDTTALARFMKFWLLAVFSFSSQAAWFQSAEHQGRWAFAQQNYPQAANQFQDPYRRGVALYRASRFADAAVAFKQPQRAEVHADALYNLGNAYFQMAQYPQAIESYQQLLAIQAKHPDGAFNLALARKLLALQQKQQNKPLPPKKPPKKSPKAEKSKNSPQKDESKAQPSEQTENAQKKGSGTKEGGQGQQQRANSDSQPVGQTAIQTGQNGFAQPSKNSSQQAMTAGKQTVAPRPPSTYEPIDSPAVHQFDQQKTQTEANTARPPLAVHFSERQVKHWLSHVEGDASHLLKNQFMLEEMRQNKQSRLFEPRPW